MRSGRAHGPLQSASLSEPAASCRVQPCRNECARDSSAWMRTRDLRLLLLVCVSAEDRRTGPPSGDQGVRRLQQDRHHPRLHLGRGSALGPGRRLSQALRATGVQWETRTGARGRSRNTL